MSVCGAVLRCYLAVCTFFLVRGYMASFSHFFSDVRFCYRSKFVASSLVIANASRCVCTYGQSTNPRSACLLICCIACWERAISHILGSFRFAIRLLGPFRTGFCGNVFVYYIEKCLLIDTSSLVTWAIVYDLFSDRSVCIPVQRLQYKASQFSVCKWKLTFLKKSYVGKNRPS